jgi:hypothetical protein
MSSGSNRESSSSAKRLIDVRYLIVAAAIWHVSIAVIVFGIGKYQLAPAQIHPSGIGAFAADGLIYQDQCLELCRILKSEGFIAWATWPTQLHVRLYSLPLAPVSRWIAFNILTIEPLNLLYYLAILVLVFKIGQRLFDYQSALIAAAIAGLWPTFLLHTTQLLRDPLLILAVLVFTWTVVESLRQEWPWRRALVLALTASLTVVLIWIVRLPMWPVLAVMTGTTIILLFLRFWREKRIAAGNALFAIFLLAAIIATPRFQPYFRNQQESRMTRFLMHEEVQGLPIEDQIAARRSGFNYQLDKDGNVIPSEAGSRIDTELRVHSLRDVIQQLPRAIAVGFFAPFPNSWFQTGRQVGFIGRLVAGVETLLTYLIEGLALFGLWRARRNLAAWFLFVFIAAGAVALGLAVNNMGALYRLRYPFWILMVILAAGGIHELAGRLRSKFLHRQ